MLCQDSDRLKHHPSLRVGTRKVASLRNSWRFGRTTFSRGVLKGKNPKFLAHFPLASPLKNCMTAGHSAGSFNYHQGRHLAAGFNLLETHLRGIFWRGFPHQVYESHPFICLLALSRTFLFVP
jgi:hypothetical protein